MTRRVVLICGPPGSGKTTLARSLDGLEVYDRDDPEWCNSEAAFTAALKRIGRDPRAQAAVIRTGATRTARQRAVTMCNATEVITLPIEASVCEARVRARGRVPIHPQLVGIAEWWKNYEPESLDIAVGSVSESW